MVAPTPRAFVTSPQPWHWRAVGRALGYGFLVWVIPFVVALALFPLRVNQRPLFESLMAVVLVVCGVVAMLRYWRSVGGGSPWHGLGLGLLWLVMSVALDLPLMLTPPIAMSLPDYLMDVAATYLIFPVLTLGMSLAAADRQPD